MRFVLAHERLDVAHREREAAIVKRDAADREFRNAWAALTESEQRRVNAAMPEEDPHA